MKKTKIITVKAILTPAHIRKEDRYVCDFCGYESTGAGIGYMYSMRECILCERHVCQKLDNSCVRIDNSDGSDYPDCYCPICYELRWTTYRKEIEDIEEEAYNKKEAVLDKIKKESLQRKTT